MHNHIATTIRPLMKMWSAAAKNDLDLLPRPEGRASAHVAGPHPLRLLILGTGIGMGYGVLSHDLALPGHLARQLSAMLGRGIDVDVSVRVDMTPAICREGLREMGATRYDAMILVIGMWDCFTLTDAEQWGSDYSDLLEDLHFLTPVGQELFVATLPSSPIAQSVSGVPRWVGDHHADLLNAQIKKMCADNSFVTMIDLAKPGSPETEQSSAIATYATLAGMMVPKMSSTLSSPSRPRLMSLDRIDESHRQSALDRLNIVDTDPEDRFDRIVDLARRMFGTESAAISFIDGNRQWFKARRGIGFAETRRADAFCNVTIMEDGPLVVENAAHDVRFVDNALVTGGPKIRFYAGYPIEAPDGEKVGTLCIFDPESREFDADDVQALRSIALLAQDALWVGSREHAFA